MYIFMLFKVKDVISLGMDQRRKQDFLLKEQY
jgi:hypothetical protein